MIIQGMVKLVSIIGRTAVSPASSNSLSVYNTWRDIQLFSIPDDLK